MAQKTVLASYIDTAGSKANLDNAVCPSEQINFNGYGSIYSGATEDSTMTEGTVTFDIRFRAIIPHNGETVTLIINVEAQNNFYPGYPLIKRGIYYCYRMISA